MAPGHQSCVGMDAASGRYVGLVKGDEGSGLQVQWRKEMPLLSHPATANSPVGRKKRERVQGVENCKKPRARPRQRRARDANAGRPGPCPSAATASSPLPEACGGSTNPPVRACAGLADRRRVCGGIRWHAMPRGKLVASLGAEDDAAYLVGHIADGGLTRRRCTTSGCSRRGR